MSKRKEIAKKAPEQKKFFSGVVDFDFSETRKDHSAKRFLEAVVANWDSAVLVWCVLHDCDTYSENVFDVGKDGKAVLDPTGAPKVAHAEGSRKVEHIHFVIKSERKKTEGGFREKLQSALTNAGYGPNGEKFKMELITASFCYSFKYAVRYLIHEDENPLAKVGVVLHGDKFPYDSESIETNDRQALQLCLDNIDPTSLTSEQLIDCVNSCSDFYEVIQKIGIENSKRYFFLIRELMKGRFDHKKKEQETALFAKQLKEDEAKEALKKS
jgi:hypothetical protein